MSYGNYGQLGESVWGSVGQGTVGGSAPTAEFVMNGISYRIENAKAYRKVNGQLIPVTNQQELNALEDYYANNIYKSNIVGGTSELGTGTVVAVIGVLALLFLMRR